MTGVLQYDGHAVSLWRKSTKGVVADEPQSDLQGLHREVQARRSNSEIVALRTETGYEGVHGGQDGI